MRIAIISPAHPLRGGIAASSERLARELQGMGHQVVIFSFSLQYPDILFPGKTQYTDDPAPADLHIRTEINSVNPLNWVRTALRLRRYQPDLIVSRFWLPFMGPSVGTIQRLAGKRAVRVGLIDNALPHESRPGDRPLTRWYLGSLDAALVMSQAVADDLARLGFRKPVARAPHPVYDNFGAPATREEAIQSLGLSANATWLLFFGFIRPYKGLDLAIEALASPLLRQREDLRLLVAGESYTDTAPWRDLAERLGVADRIVWHEQYIPTERVRYYFGAADLVVQPYKSATQSGITQIAYHFGKPMVVTRVGGLPEMVPHERAGLVVPPTAEAIAEAIARYLDDEHLRQQLEKGVREVARQYTWAHLAETLLALASASRDKS